MVCESIQNNTQDAMEEIFLRLKEKIVDIFCNMSLFMVALENKFGHFKEVGGSNTEVGYDEKLGDNEDLQKESRK
jgi:hypothetical protein